MFKVILSLIIKRQRQREIKKKEGSTSYTISIQNIMWYYFIGIFNNTIILSNK